MQLATRLEKKYEKELRGANARQINIALIDADIIERTLDALENVKASAAREILSNPKDLKRLLINDSKNPVVCFYVLHALFIILALREINQKEFLNSMSDENIGVLHELITVAKTRIRPIPKILASLIQKRKKEQLATNSLEYIQNKAMISSARLSINIDKYWEDAIQELEIWLDAIDNFKREEKNSQTTDSLEKWWTLKELADKLGCPNMNVFYMKKCELLKQKPFLTAEINSWFGQKGVKKLFNPKCFAELKTLWNEVSTVSKPAAKKGNSKKAAAAKVDVTVRKPRKPKTAKAATGTQPKVKKQDKKLKTLVDVKAFETFLIGLQNARDEALKDLEDKEKSYQALACEVLATEAPDKRTDLLSDVSAVKEAVKNSKNEFETLVDKFSEGAQLLLQQQNIEKAFKQITTKIETFMRENQELVK